MNASTGTWKDTPDPNDEEDSAEDEQPEEEEYEP